LIIAGFLIPAVALSAWAQQIPPSLKSVGLDQKLDSQLPLDVMFRDENGKAVKLQEYFGKKPVVLSFAYYTCPMLCTMLLDGMVRGLRAVPAEMGPDYEAVNISIDPNEKTSAAAAKKKEYLGKYGRAGAETGWHFLTGDQSSIKKVADAAGFRYVYDPVSKQFAHASGILILTPDGRISRYFYGIVFSPRDLRLGLSEASSSKISSPVDKLLLFCYHYDALTGKYSLLISRLVQLGGGMTVLLMGVFWLALRRRVHRRLIVPKTASH
jgi:protein SCO1